MTLSLRLLALVLALLAPLAQQAAAQSTKAKVYVTSVGAQNGFTDPSKDNRDTAKDIRDDLKGKKGIALTDVREEAAIVLVVMGRESEGVTANAFGAGRDRTLRVKFIAAGTEADMTASAMSGVVGSAGAWGKAAGKIADQVADWVKENGARLQAASSQPTGQR